MSDKNKSNGVLKFQRIRRYLWRIYLYGFFKRRDFKAMNHGSAKNYSSILTMIEELFPEDDNIKKRDHHSIARKYHLSGSSRLTDAYMYHSLDPDTDMVEFLHILALLHNGDKTISQIDEWFGLHLMNPPSKNTVRNRIRQLVEYGCIELRERDQYGITKDSFSSLSDSQLTDLYRYVCFTSCTTYPRVAGSFLRRNLERHLHRRGLEVPTVSPFLLRHNTYNNIFDEELLYRLEVYRNHHQWTLFDGRKRLPVEIRVDTNLGRWYVLCLSEEMRPCIENLIRIEDMEPLEAASDVTWADAVKMISDAFSHTLCSGHIADPVLVEAKMNFDQAPGLRNQFLREIRLGEVITKEDGEYYQVWLNDPVELKTFLRTYMPYLKVLPGNHKLPELLQQDIAEMLQALN